MILKIIVSVGWQQKNKCKNEEKKSRTIEYSRWSRWTLKKKKKLIYVWNILCIPSHIWVLIFHFKKNLSYNFAVLDIRLSFQWVEIKQFWTLIFLYTDVSLSASCQTKAGCVDRAQVKTTQIKPLNEFNPKQHPLYPDKAKHELQGLRCFRHILIHLFRII